MRVYSDFSSIKIIVVISRRALVAEHDIQVNIEQEHAFSMTTCICGVYLQ